MATPIIAPYGSWRSSVNTQSIIFEQVAIDGKDVYWSEGRPNEGGRIALVHLAPSRAPEDCLPIQFSIRSRVHEYGGGDFAVFDGVLYFVNAEDQHLYRQPPNSAPEQLTSRVGYRYADLVCDIPRSRLICIREDHTGPNGAKNTIVAIPFAGGEEEVLLEGYDFFSTPRPSAQ